MTTCSLATFNQLLVSAVRQQPANLDVATARHAARHAVIANHPGVYLSAMAEMGRDIDVSNPDAQLAIAMLRQRFGDNPEGFFQQKVAEAKRTMATNQGRSNPSAIISQVLNSHPGLQEAIDVQQARVTSRRSRHQLANALPAREESLPHRQRHMR